MKNKVFIVVVAIVAIGGFFLLKNMQTPAPTPVATPAASVSSVAASESFIRPHSPSVGNTMGRVTVVEWFDPECPPCAMFYPVLKKIENEYKDRVRFVFRYMPYHQHSMYAAAVLAEAYEQGKFEEALEIVFAKQKEWGPASRPDLIPGFLSKLGLSAAQLEPSKLAAKHDAKIRQDESDGNTVGVNGTPTFFVNGQILPQLGEETLRAAIEAALK